MSTQVILSRRLDAAFTLTELLVVVLIIVLMASLGVGAFKGGTASDGSRGASYEAATLFDSARNEAIMRRVKARVIFDTVYNANLPENYLRRMTIAYSDSTGTNWTQSGRWIKFPANAYYDIGASLGGAPRSRPYDTNMTLSSSFGSGVTPNTSGYWAYEYLPNGQASYGTNQVLKVVFTPGSTLGGTFSERPDLSSLYGFVLNRMGHTQQFFDIASLKNCP